MLTLTMWMNMPSFYQADLFRALTSSGEVDLQVIFARKLAPDRLQLGWQNDLTGYPYCFLNKNHSVLDAMRLAISQRDRLHVVNGIWAELSFFTALVALALAGSPYAIYSEAPNPSLSRSIAKKLLQAAFGRVFVQRAVGVLPVSSLAVRFFKDLGASEQTIYPFGYFRSSPKLADDVIHPKNQNRTEVIFAGQVIHRKGIDLLLEAMLPLFSEYPDLFLTAVGDGDLLQPLREQVEALDMSERVAFEGIISSDQIPARLKNADLLVLPSLFDGWGLVVNEAFSVGLPVIVSDHCGASDLVRNGVNGYVFRSEDVTDLRLCLSRFLDRKADWAYFRAQSAATGEKISTRETAPYLINCLKHMAGMVDERPSPPWM